MRVRLIIEKELESLWGAEDLLEDHGGVATKEFCKDLLELSIMEDISSYIFPNGEPQYDPLIVLEVVDTKQTNNTPLVGNIIPLPLGRGFIPGATDRNSNQYPRCMA